MKILMLAPEPFFQPRGTPISIYFRIKALSDLGHNVDLITYHLGEDKRINGLKILRIPDLFSIKIIKIGPSFAKIPLDFLLLCKATWQMMKKHYDLIFSHDGSGQRLQKSGEFLISMICIPACRSSWRISVSHALSL